MFQFSPVIPRTPLYTSVINLFGLPKESARKKAVLARLATSPEMVGAKLFVKFWKMELTEQMRAAGDTEHIQLITEMRKAEPNMYWMHQSLQQETERERPSIPVYPKHLPSIPQGRDSFGFNLYTQKK